MQESCNQNENVQTKVAQIIHYLYDQEIVDEDAILTWHEDLDEDNFLRKSLKKLVEWLEQSSEEESSDDED